MLGHTYLWCTEQNRDKNKEATTHVFLESLLKRPCLAVFADLFGGIEFCLVEP